jgi:hypothetical protein
MQPGSEEPMNEILRKQIWRKLENLPEEKVYAVLDFIEFLESEYGSQGAGEAPAFQRFAENFQKQMRRARVPATAVRESMKVLGATDRVFDAFRQAGREFLAELEQGKPEPPPKETSKPPENREIIVD